MNRTITVLTLLTLIFSALWLVLLIASMAAAGPLDTFDKVLAHVSGQGILFTLTYANAALVTLFTTAWFASLYQAVRHTMPTRSLVGLAFLPVYCAINLFVYLSQITIVPALTAALGQPETAAAARLLLAQLIQEWPASGAAFFNNLAYGVLAIPSILYGVALARQGGALRPGGWLLALNGAACILGAAGMLLHLDLLSIGSVVGGVLFIAALPFLYAGLRK